MREEFTKAIHRSSKFTFQPIVALRCNCCSKTLGLAQNWVAAIETRNIFKFNTVWAPAKITAVMKSWLSLEPFNGNCLVMTSAKPLSDDERAVLKTASSQSQQASHPRIEEQVTSAINIKKIAAVWGSYLLEPFISRGSSVMRWSPTVTAFAVKFRNLGTKLANPLSVKVTSSCRAKKITAVWESTLAWLNASSDPFSDEDFWNIKQLNLSTTLLTDWRKVTETLQADIKQSQRNPWRQ